MSHERLVHDLRAPLARAKTIAKLLHESDRDNEWVTELIAALEELDGKILALLHQSDM